MVENELCQVRVSGEGQWGSFQQYQCSKKAVVTRDGKRYCKIHDPEYIKEQDTKRATERKKVACPKCGRRPKSWFTYCPFCGTKYPPRWHHQIRRRQNNAH